MPALFLFICGTQKESPQLRSFAALTDACKPFCKQICSQVNLFKSELIRFLSCLRCKPCEFFHKPNTDSPFTSHLSGGTFPTLSGGTFPTLSGGTFPTLSGGTFPTLSGGTFPTLSGGTFPTLFRGTFPDPQTLLSSISLSLKKREMHHIADTATRMYTILESTAV